MQKKSRLMSLFVGMCAVLLVSIIGIFAMGEMVLYQSRQMAIHRSCLTDLTVFQSTVTDAETGQRGYLLTGEDAYLQPYHDAVARMNSELASLKAHVAAGELPADSIAELDHLTATKLAELEQTISTRRSQGLEPAIQIVRTNSGRNTMDAIRSRVNQLTMEQEKQFEAARQFADHLTRTRTFLFIAAVIVNLAFLIWTYRRIKCEMEGRRSAGMEVERQKDLLAVTLASIGDAVIVTDMVGHISYLNAVAAELTGWSVSDATGQNCSKVFHIVNEDTRQIVESPVDKVLRSGAIVGLANHTMLIRKDGTEIPIDDSGAPVRDADGALRGVVLVFRDFSEQKNIEKSLRKAKAEVEAASNAKDQFLAALSHELRTPLTPVLATLTSWEASDQLPASLVADVQMLRRNLELEARLIDDLLDLTRIEKGKLRLNLEVADVHELIQAVTGMYHSDLIARKLKVVMTLDARQHFVHADPARLQQVFWNILKNAVKFTAEKGTIYIESASDSGGKVIIRVRDTGIGMSHDMLERLFKPFEQGGETRIRKYGGLGLGMAISKALMDAQGGTIDASSPGAGLGSTFTVELPAVSAPVHSVPTVGKPAEPPQRRRLQILLVEDHADTAMVMARLLKGLGHHVQIAGTLARATDLAAKTEFDLLLSDIGLPDGTGIDLIRDIRERKGNKMPAVALTGYGMEEDIAKCMEAGFDDHLTKPVSFQRLEMLIRRLANSEAVESSR